MTKHIYLLLALLMLFLCMAAQPEIAFAQTPPAAPTIPPACVHTPGSGSYSAAVVNCIETSVKNGVKTLLQTLSDYMKPVVAALCTLAVIAFGVRVMAGESQVGPQTISMTIRIGLVVMFSYNLGNFAGYVFDVLGQLLSLVTAKNATCSPYPWCGIDNFLGKMLGFGKDQHGKDLLLFNGIIGLLSGALFSSTLGFMLFFIGLSALISVVLFVFQVVYLYLTSIVVIGFLLVISPIIIPFAIFQYGERYFKQWLNLLLSAILVPVMMYAFLWVFFGIFDDLLGAIFKAIGGNENLPSYMHANRPLLSWLMPTDPNTVHELGALGGDTRPVGVAEHSVMHIPPVQTFTDPSTRFSMNSNLANPPVVNFGASDGSIKQGLIYNFISLWIFAMLMKSMMDKIPDVASTIAGARTGITLGMSSLQQTASGFNDKIRNLGQPQAPQDQARRAMNSNE